tara:strand:+ start:126 stop:344 length:219 start_codon:yes stop_codon:yes gene_type:complete
MNDLKKLGEIFAALMEERGYDINDHTPVMNGLGAYFVLDLKGLYPVLDKEVEQAINKAYDMAMTTIHKNKLH